MVCHELLCEVLGYSETAPALDRAVGSHYIGHEVVGTPVPVLALHPTSAAGVVEEAEIAVVLDVGLEYLLLVGISLDVEVVKPPVGRNKLVVLGVDDRLQAAPCVLVVSGIEVRLSRKGVGESLGNLHGTVLVAGALPLVEVLEGLLALLGAPLEKAGLIHTAELGVGVAVVGVGVTRKHMVYERRGPPAEGQHHMDICAYNAGLGNHPILDVARSVLEMVGHEVRIIEGIVESVVHVADHLGVGVVAELVQLGGKVIVAVESARRIDIVTAHVEREKEGNIDGGAVLRGDIPQEALVDCDERGLCILVGLVEGLRRYCTLLGNLQTVGVTASKKTGCGKCRYGSYKLYFHIHILFRT